MRRLAAALLLAAIPAHAADLPRLTGTLIGPDGRTALFARPGGTIQAAVGERVGDYVVTGIEPGLVQLEQPGRHVAVSLEAAAGPAPAARNTGATFGLVLRQPGPADD